MLYTATLACLSALVLAADLSAQTYDVTADWSDLQNPNGVWSYREGSNLLPHVDWWQSAIGGWNAAQPGWAISENNTDRIPFFFRSLGEENFFPDFGAGDVVMHTRDDSNGFGNGEGTLVWTSPLTGFVSLEGGVWMGRDIGRSNSWTILRDGGMLTMGGVSSGDAWSKANPLPIAMGIGGAAAIQNIPVIPGTEISFVFAKTSLFGDFIGMDLRIVVDAGFTKFCGSSQNPNNVATIELDSIDSGSSAIQVSLAGGPSGQFAYLLVGDGMTTVNQPVGAVGDLCVSGGTCLGRYVQDVGPISASGTFDTEILNPASLPCAGAVVIQAGATWNFQYWHRQAMGQPATFSEAVAVTFQ